MKRALAAVAVVVALVLGARFAIAHRDDGHAYTARQVQAGILQHPAGWFGRTVLVRGVVSSAGLLYPPAGAGGAARRYAIGDPAATQALAWSVQAVPTDLSVPVVPDPQEPLIVDQSKEADGWLGSLVRRLPLLDRLLAVPSADGRHPATYRVAISDASNDLGCTVRICYHAVLLDPAPHF